MPKTSAKAVARPKKTAPAPQTRPERFDKQGAELKTLIDAKKMSIGDAAKKLGMSIGRRSGCTPDHS